MMHHVVPVFAKYFHFWKHFRRNTLAQKGAIEETPLRAELFSASQMEEHGRTLAGMHLLDEGRVPERLLTRLAENEDVLLDVRDLLIEAVKANRRIAPAGEWVLDNFYLIEEQIRTAKRLSAEGLCEGPSAFEKRSVTGASPRVRHCAGDDFPRRRPGGSGAARKLCGGLSDGRRRCGSANCGRSPSCCVWR